MISYRILCQTCETRRIYHDTSNFSLASKTQILLLIELFSLELLLLGEGRSTEQASMGVNLGKIKRM